MIVLVRSVRIRRMLAPIAAATLGIFTAGAAFAAIELPTDKAALIALGKEHRTAEDLYKAFQTAANGGPTGAAGSYNTNGWCAAMHSRCSW